MNKLPIHWPPELSNESSNLIDPPNMSPGPFLQDYTSYLASSSSTMFDTFSSFERPETSKQVPTMGGEDDWSLKFLSFGNEEPSNDGLEFYKASIGEYAEAKDEMETVVPLANEKNIESQDFEVPSSTQVHAVTERKRREKLAELFVMLSKIVPGLKKTDKASVIEDAINYLKHLESKVKMLEAKAMMRTTESITLAKEPQGNPSGTSLLKIEARLIENTVLMRIQCEACKGMLATVISEVEKLHLTVMSTNAVPFGGSSLNITVAAKIEVGFSMTLKDLERNLKSAVTLLPQG